MFYFRLLDEEIQEIVEQGSLDLDEIFPSGEPSNYNIFIYSALNHSKLQLVQIFKYTDYNR